MKRILRLLGYLRHFIPHTLAAVLLMAMVGLLEAFRLLLIKPIFDNVLHPGATQAQQQALPLLGGFNARFGSRIQLDLHALVPPFLHNEWDVVAFTLVAATLLKSLCDYFGTYLVNYAGFGMITALRDDLYESMLRRSISFFQRHSTGTLLSTLINDIERVQFAMSSVLSDFLQQLFTLIFTLCVVIMLGGKLAWLLLIFVPVVALSVRRIGRNVRTTTRGGQDKLAEIQNILHETITGNRIVKAFNMERWELGRFREAARRLFRANLRSVRAQALSSPLMDAIGAVAIALLLLVGRGQIQHTGMTTGQFFAFLVALFKLYDPVRKFALYYNNFQQALGASSEIFRFMDDQDELPERPGALRLKGFRHAIQLEDVGFQYDQAPAADHVAVEAPAAVADLDRSDEASPDVDRLRAPATLASINLTIHEGEVIALVGPSGAGKSTLANLIPRFFDVTSGRILIDGHDLRDVALRSLREQIGTVTQETILFNDTIRNNIAYGLPDVPMARVREAARCALAHDFIERLPDGYNTHIGEKGFRLSGGERQRIAIARALLKDAPILILDEATSSLDAESESLVQPALGNLMSGRTVIVIAHRLSTVRRATRIGVMEAGRLTAIGTHEELMHQSATYQRLHELQFGDLAAPLASAPAGSIANEETRA
ncbi:ABC transporter ATP-binding protein [Acidipila sp. EB88]|uniref:ABC transporter ATP-binding protein n=1 Tax=Acidipila sp. EB88 TaxID=2305226 RepID=UPI000F5EC0D1|nr:ABC transporter ATP-binding protein [Acidipila sp. EB88]RRA49216.1 ABC transporter ATP-binding protein [Acidipila sp. EB88]